MFGRITAATRRAPAIFLLVIHAAGADISTLPLQHKPADPGSTEATFLVNSTLDAQDANTGDGLCSSGPPHNVCTLRAAIMQANTTSGRDTINLPAGTYSLTATTTLEDLALDGDLDIRNDLIINGDGMTATVIVGAASGDRAVQVVAPARVSISSLTISGAVSQLYGGAIHNAGELTLTLTHIGGNRALDGGGIYNSGVLRIENSAVADNANTSSHGNGGGIVNSGKLMILATTLRGNHGGNMGGAILNGGVLTVTGSLIEGNSARDGGGVLTAGSLVITNTQIVSNNATAAGGGLRVTGGVAAITDARFAGNAAQYGGGLSVATANALVERSQFERNTATGGGGLYNEGALSVVSSTIGAPHTQPDDGNTAAGGGGLANGAFGVLTITASTVSYNKARIAPGSAGDGGGVSNWGHGVVTIINSTVAHNTAEHFGGALVNYDNATVAITYTTVASNVASAAALYSYGGIVSLGASVIGATRNISGTPIANCAHVPGASITSRGYNLSGDGSCALTGPGDTDSATLGLDDLRLNPPGTTETHALTATSAALNRVSPAAWCGAGMTDQRGVPRPQSSACDSGAYERAASRTVSGRAVNTLSSGLGDVTVTVGGVATTSGADGHIRIDGLWDGQHAVHASKPGFAFVMTPTTIGLPAFVGELVITGFVTAPSIDSTFRPITHGLAFANFSTIREGITITGWNLFTRTYPGAEVINIVDGSRKPAAEYVYTTTFAVADGHCRGMSHTSLIWYAGLRVSETVESEVLTGVNASVSLTGTIHQLEATGHPSDVRLGESDARDYIHIYHNRWYTDQNNRELNTQGYPVAGQPGATPSQTVQRIRDALWDFPDNAIDVFFYSGTLSSNSVISVTSVGHSVVPISITRSGNTDYIYVYDSNAPNVTGRYISVTAESWSYPALGWSETNWGLYVTRARANFPATRTMTYTRSSRPPELASHTMFSEPDTTWLQSMGTAALSVVDSAGRTLDDGESANVIAGASLLIQPEFNPDRPDAAAPALYRLPAQAYTVTLHALPGKPPPTGLVVFGPGQITAIESAAIAPGSPYTLTLSADRRQLTMSAAEAGLPYCYRFADDTLADAGREFVLCAETPERAADSITVAADNDSIAYQRGGGSTQYTLQIRQTGVNTGLYLAGGQLDAGEVLNIAASSRSDPAAPGGVEWQRVWRMHLPAIANRGPIMRRLLLPILFAN